MLLIKDRDLTARTLAYVREGTRTELTLAIFSQAKMCRDHHNTVLLGVEYTKPYPDTLPSPIMQQYFLAYIFPRLVIPMHDIMRRFFYCRNISDTYSGAR